MLIKCGDCTYCSVINDGFNRSRINRCFYNPPALIFDGHWVITVRPEIKDLDAEGCAFGIKKEAIKE